MIVGEWPYERAEWLTRRLGLPRVYDVHRPEFLFSHTQFHPSV